MEQHNTQVPESVTSGMGEDFVEHTHRDYGPGYFCTPDVMAKVESMASINAELLEALKGLVRNSTRADWPDDIYDAAEAAIKKATA